MHTNPVFDAFSILEFWKFKSPIRLPIVAGGWGAAVYLSNFQDKGTPKGDAMTARMLLSCGTPWSVSAFSMEWTENPIFRSLNSVRENLAIAEG